MRNSQDQLAKRLFSLLLSRAGRCEVSKEVHHEVLDAQLADLYFEPDPKQTHHLSALGLLGRLARSACLFEPFSSAPSSEAVLECIRKQLNLSKQLREESSGALRACQQPKGTIDRDEVLPLLLQYQRHLLSVPQEARRGEQESYMINAEQMIDEIEARGEAKGEAAGELKGRAETVLKLLRLKFDAEVTPQIEAQVRGANLEQLERYTERVLSENTLEGILRND